MKKYTIAVLVVLLAITANLNASPNINLDGGKTVTVNVALNELTKNRHILAFEKPENEKVLIKIYSKSGVLMYKHKIGKGKDAVIRYDMSGLPIGTYNIIILGQKGQTLFENTLSVK